MSTTQDSRYDVAFYLPSMTPLIVTSGNDASGGAETQVLLLSQALAKRGVSVCVVVFDVPGVAIPDAIGGVDVVVRPPYHGGGNIFGRLKELAAMRAALRQMDARVVVTRSKGLHVGIVGFFTKLASRRFVYSSASLWDFKKGSGLAKWRDRVLFRLGVALADEVIVQTEEQVSLCQDRFGRTPIVIRSISEQAEECGADPEAFLWVGRIEPNKRPLEFVELARALPEAQFWMVGSPSPNAPASARLAEAIGTAARELPNLAVFPPRPRPELLALMARAVAVVSTSESEGTPNIFLEAWARGIPALALNHDPDAIIAGHRLGGFADGRRDRLVELARELWDRRDAPGEYRARCRAYVQSNHSPEAVSARWVRALGLESEALPQRLLVESR